MPHTGSVLEDEADLVRAQRRELGLGQATELLTVDDDAAAARAQQAAEHREQGRLAAARGAHDQDDLARADREVEVADCVDGRLTLAEAARHVADVEHGAGAIHLGQLL